MKGFILMRTLYVIAGGIWQGAKWVWTVIVVAILVSVASTLISGDKGAFVKSVFIEIVNWFIILGTIQLITLGAIVFFTLLALTSGIFTVIFKSYGPQYALPPEVQAVFDHIKNDIEAMKQKEDLRQDRKKEALTGIGVPSFPTTSLSTTNTAFPTLDEVSSPSSSSITRQSEQLVKDTEEKQQDSGKHNTFIHGQVQGLIHGEHNTVTLIFQEGKEQTIPFLAPPQPPYNLVGRDNMMQKLKQQLFRGGNLALSALNGLPGVGKTALALALAHDHEVLAHFCDGVLWAGLGRESNVFSHLGTWGLALGFTPFEIENFTTNYTLLMQTIHRAIGARRMLLVIDDAWSVEAALNFKLGGPNCAHLVTTRLPEVAEVFAADGNIVVQELGEDDGLTLLERLAPRVVETVPDEARELVHAVGGLPLPLTLMGKYLRIQMRTGQPRRLLTALERLHRVEERLQLSQPQAGLEHHPSLSDSVPLSLLEVIKISDEALDEEARQALRALTVFPSKPNTFSEEAALAVAATSTKTIDTLTDFGLLESSGPSRYTLHQAISDYTRTKLTDELVYERMVEFFIHFVENRKTDNNLLEREMSNTLAAVEIMLEREMHPAGASVFAHLIKVLRRTRAI